MGITLKQKQLVETTYTYTLDITDKYVEKTNHYLNTFYRSVTNEEIKVTAEDIAKVYLKEWDNDTVIYASDDSSMSFLLRDILYESIELDLQVECVAERTIETQNSVL